MCRKRVGLLSFTCKCDPTLSFCTSHRLPEEHGCTFDHKLEGMQLLAEKNPKVQDVTRQRMRTEKNLTPLAAMLAVTTYDR